MKTVHLRFYEELNDFLPLEKRKIRFSHSFKNNPSIKDMIESLGIPHTQVDFILSNNNAVDFNYIVQNGDEISVYPVFESLDIQNISKLRPTPLRQIKFIADVHLGKLARYLRMLGFDTLYQNNYTPNQILKISKLEKRIILTKSRELLKRKEVTHGYCITESNLEIRLKRVLNRFNLYDSIIPFSRCMICNTNLESVSKEKIIDRIPKKVKEWQKEFKICPNCNKIYWKGTHYESMMKFINSLNKNKT
ncbi:MAG: Mut7-C RNAse domain-containing protein [Candidatus Cloacimonadota bacterium]|nr:Mut7-C RNAse domain-containing protein [Candidatus Cloacimonadota bacterium]